MNKLEGFYELRRSNLPTVPWLEYSANVALDDSVLWTVRSSVSAGNDLNLPRKIGVTQKKLIDLHNHYWKY